MPHSSSCRQCRPTWFVAAFAALAACGGSEGGGNAVDSGPGTTLPDVRDATGGTTGIDANDESQGPDGDRGSDAADVAVTDSASPDARRDIDMTDAAADITPDVSADAGPLLDVAADLSSGDAAQPDGDAKGPPIVFDAACVTSSMKAQRLTPALYLIVESSTSMDTVDPQQTMSRWAALAAAMPLFVDDAANSGLSVGLDFFPEGGSTASCLVSDYIMPEVAIGPLAPSSAQGMAMTSAMTSRARTAGSPTTPALQGALQHARDWANSKSQLPPPIDVLLVTDGLPSGCSSSLSSAAQAAQMATLGTPSIRTHVLAVGAAPDNLDAIAAAGGTTQAVYVAESTADAVRAGLQTVRAHSETCSFAFPSNQDPTKVILVLGDADGGVTELGLAPSSASCGTANGWFYDNPAQPKKATLCPTPCAALQAGASVTMLFGCEPRRLPP